MNDFWIYLTAAGLTGVLYLVAIRVLTRYISLPCPPGFIFLLESRLMDRVAGPEAIIQRAGIEPGMVVLDAGCGPGRMSIPLARTLLPHGHLVALDLQAGMLERLARKVKEAGLTNITQVQGGLGAGLLGENRFQRAILITVLGEIPDQLGALEEIRQALVPGGILSVTEVLPDPHYQGLRKVARLANAAGFQTELVHRGWRSYTLNLRKPAQAN